jgi:hypothetical protein
MRRKPHSCATRCRCGFALSSFSPRLWARLGAAMATSAALIARSVLTPMIAGAIAAHQQDRRFGERSQAPPS